MPTVRGERERGPRTAFGPAQREQEVENRERERGKREKDKNTSWLLVCLWDTKQKESGRDAVVFRKFIVLLLPGETWSMN